MDDPELLKAASLNMGVYLTDTQIEQFMIFKSYLINENKKFNLTAITNDKDIILKHFADSLSVLPELNGAQSLIDVGCGAGFPGIPIKIARPDIKLVLLDSLEKRVNFLKNTVSLLRLSDVECLHDRAEDLGQNPIYREMFDVSIARGVSSLNILAELCIPFVKPEGSFIAMKGPDSKQEIIDSESAIDTLGGSVSLIKHIDIPFCNISHSLIVIRKLRQTSPVYPRKPKKIIRKPL